MISLLKQFFQRRMGIKACTIENSFNTSYSQDYIPELSTLRAPYAQGHNRETLITAIRGLLGLIPLPKHRIHECPLVITSRKNGRKAVLSRIKRLVQDHIERGEPGIDGYSDELLAYLYIGLLEYHLHIPMGIYGHWVEGEGIIDALKDALNGKSQ